MFFPDLFAHRVFNFAISATNLFGFIEVQSYSANVCLVCDRLRMELYHYWIADLVRNLDRLLFIRGHACCNSRDAISREDLLGLEFGESSPACFSRVVDYLPDQISIWRVLIRV